MFVANLSRLTAKRLGTMIGFITVGAVVLVVVSLLAMDVKIVFCDRFSTSKYSFPSLSVTDIISVILLPGSVSFLNFTKSPIFLKSLTLFSPDTTCPAALTA